jgi:hypothetical protein
VTHGQTTLNNKKLVPSISLISLTKKCFPNKLHRNTVRTWMPSQLFWWWAGNSKIPMTSKNQ